MDETIADIIIEPDDLLAKVIRYGEAEVQGKLCKIINWIIFF